MSSGMMATWLFDSLLVTTLLMAAILLVRRPVAKLFGPGVAYALWAIPAARLLMPSLTGDAVPISETGAGVGETVRQSILTNVATVEPATVPIAASPGVDYAALGLTFWLGGAVLFFIIQMIRYASMRDELLSDARQIALIDKVRVVASDQVAGPLAFGLFKRYIAVPENFTKAYSPAERELALAHEMAHHKSGDLFANLAAFTVLCLMWFNPLAWASWRAFRFDQEAACDARVLSGKCAEDRVIYGQALARTAFDGVPTFATALNSPKTIIERLRRLTMKDASKTRRSLGKLGILTAAAIILPLTATIVPAVNALDDGAAADKSGSQVIRKSVTAITTEKPWKTVDIVGHDGDDKEVTRVDRDGKVFIFRTDRKLSDEDVEKMIDEAERSREAAEDALADIKMPAAPTPPLPPAPSAAPSPPLPPAPSAAPSHWSADAPGRATAEMGRVEAIRVMSNMNFASYIPEIHIREITRNCREGQPVTTSVRGFDGHNKSSVRIVLCGKGQAKLARTEALNGLRAARREISAEKDMPANIRWQMIESLEKQIRKLEAEADQAG
jgi:bla regulator protein blaR1